MSDSQQPQTPLARLEQLERQIASRVEDVVQSLRREIGDGVRTAGEEIERLLEAVRQEKPEPAPAAPAPAGPDFASLVGAVARINGQAGQADVIKTLLEESAPFASRAVFFLVRQAQIRAWSSQGFGSASGRVEGLHATTDQPPWNSTPGDAASVLDAEQTAAFSKVLGISVGADAAWIPFVLRGQPAGALYVDRLEGDGDLGIAALQLLTHSAATSLETAASSPGVSATLELRGKVPEVFAEEHTIAVDDEPAAEEATEGEAPEEEAAEEEAAEEAVDSATEAEEEIAVEEDAEVDEEPTDATDATDATGETTDETTDDSVAVGDVDEDEPTDVTEEETAEGDGDIEADVGDFEEDEEEDVEEEDIEPVVPAMELPKMRIPEAALPEVSAPDFASEEAVEFEEEDVEDFTEPPDFEMVEDTVPDHEPRLEPVDGSDLPAEAYAMPPEVPDIELGEPEPAQDFEVAEAPEVPDVEFGEPDFEPAAAAEAPEVPAVELAGAEDLDDEAIALETEDETPLDEDSSLWEAEDDEDTAPRALEDDAPEAFATHPAVPLPVAPEPPAAPDLIGNETVRIDTANLPQMTAPAPSVPAPPSQTADAVQYPSSFAEPPPPVQAPPPSFAEPDRPEETDEPSASQVVPPADMAPPPARPSSQVTPPADATPTSEVAPPEPAGSSTEVRPPSDHEGPGLAFAAPTADQTEREMDDAEEALHEEARRLARLLVSEIKLYNEEIIEEGRRTGNIYDRLRDDINRSRQMYEERIDPRLADQEDYFQQELVQRLAGGDETLLGM